MFRRLFALIAALAASAAGAQGGVHERKPADGLHVIVNEGHRARTAAHMMRQRISSGEN
jgi:hypothetical protein